MTKFFLAVFATLCFTTLSFGADYDAISFDPDGYILTAEDGNNNLAASGSFGTNSWNIVIDDTTLVYLPDFSVLPDDAKIDMAILFFYIPSVPTGNPLDYNINAQVIELEERLVPTVWTNHKLSQEIVKLDTAAAAGYLHTISDDNGTFTEYAFRFYEDGGPLTLSHNVLPIREMFQVYQLENQDTGFGITQTGGVGNIGERDFATNNEWIAELFLSYYHNYGADLDQDENVNQSDLDILLNNWTGSLPAGTGNKMPYEGDLDGDQDVDSADQLILFGEWTG